jgi:hypothetical protein
MIVTETMLISSGTGADGTNYIYAINKRTGERMGQVEIPANSSYGMSGFVHEGKQHVLVQQPNGLIAYALP